MQRPMNLLAAAAVLAAGAPLCVAQNIASSGPAEPSYTQSQPAPIERAYPNPTYPNRSYLNQDQRPYDQNPGPYGQPMPAPVTLSPGGTISAAGMPLTAHPIPGVILRVAPNSSVKEVASSNERLELRIESGVANVDVHDPQKDVLLLVDLPGGQTQMLKNGLYTFNAATNTARVLKGEARAFPASASKAESMKVKEYNKIEFGKDARPHEFVPQQAIADLIPAPPRGPEENAGARRLWLRSWLRLRSWVRLSPLRRRLLWLPRLLPLLWLCRTLPLGTLGLPLWLRLLPVHRHRLRLLRRLPWRRLPRRRFPWPSLERRDDGQRGGLLAAFAVSGHQVPMRTSLKTRRLA